MELCIALVLASTFATHCAGPARLHASWSTRVPLFHHSRRSQPAQLCANGPSLAQITQWLSGYLETADLSTVSVANVRRELSNKGAIEGTHYEADWLEEEVVRLQASPNTASLLICVNTNICGRRNPTHEPGYGWARGAIHCARTLGPPGLAVRAGTCFIRCSRGVNGQLHSAGSTVRTQPLFRLNGVPEVVAMLEETMGHHVPDDLFDAYESFSAAQILLDDTYANLLGADLTARAAEAIVPLDATLSYVRRVEPARTALLAEGHTTDRALSAALATLSAAAARRRNAWAGSRWRESYYRSELRFASGGAADGAADGATADGTADGTADDAEAGSAVDGAPAGSTEGAQTLEATYGGLQPRGRLRGTQMAPPRAGDFGVSVFCGEWSEGDACGEVVLEMSADGLYFCGRAVCDGQILEWTGERVGPPPEATRAEWEASRAQCLDRWYAEVLVMRSGARLRLGDAREATRDAIVALGFCPTMAEAWGALADAALAASDKRTARIALSECLYLRPDNRAQAMQLQALRPTDASQPVSQTVSQPAATASARLAAAIDSSLSADSATSGRAPLNEAASPIDDDTAKAIFAEEYTIEPNVP